MVTQAQIARKLGVSRQLVTFALAGYPQVSEASRERILAAAREMGYKPNPHSRALRRQRTGLIALWIPDQISTHYQHVARALGRLVKQSKCDLIVSEVGVGGADHIVSHVAVDGVCAVDASRPVQADLEALQSRGTPVVCMGAYCSQNTDRVEVDLSAGAAEAVQHLIEMGFRRIAHATFVREDAAHESRRLGYARSMRKAGLELEYIYYPLTEQQRPIARQLIQDYISKQGQPEAVFCHSDDVALGIYRGLHDLGLRVPHDVAVVGCDGIEDTEYLECPMTTLVQPVEVMCATAWQFLQRRLTQPRAAKMSQREILRPQLSVRDSSRRTPS